MNLRNLTSKQVADYAAGKLRLHTNRKGKSRLIKTKRIKGDQGITTKAKRAYYRAWYLKNRKARLEYSRVWHKKNYSPVKVKKTKRVAPRGYVRRDVKWDGKNKNQYYKNYRLARKAEAADVKTLTPDSMVNAGTYQAPVKSIKQDPSWLDRVFKWIGNA